MKIPRYEQSQGIQAGRVNALIDEVPADVKAVRRFGVAAQEAGSDMGEALVRIQNQRDAIEETRHLYAYDKVVNEYMRENVLNQEGNKTFELTKNTIPKISELQEKYISENVPQRLQDTMRLHLEKVSNAAADRTSEHEVVQLRKAKQQAITDSMIFTRAKVATLYNVDDINDEMKLYRNVAERLGATEEQLSINSAQVVIAGIQSLSEKQMWGEANTLLGKNRELLQSVGLAEAAENDIIQARNRAKTAYDLANEEAIRETNNQFAELFISGKLTEEMVVTSNLNPVGESGSKMYWIGKLREGGNSGRSVVDKKLRNDLEARILADPTSVKETEIIDAVGHGLDKTNASYLRKLKKDEEKKEDSPRRAGLKATHKAIENAFMGGLLPGDAVEQDAERQKLIEDLHTWYKNNPDKMPSEWWDEVRKKYYGSSFLESIGLGGEYNFIGRATERRAREGVPEGQTYKQFKEENEYKAWLEETKSKASKDELDYLNSLSDTQLRYYYSTKKAKK